ncbi:periplasmic protein [Roseivivax jejudonensis]|uniref:Periplasmic protein n=1 Tax=Roseivivax jejudonensis TaxID=1529041 RepID=A0A1X6Y4P3_9RHOB|nr:BON domain-containing protein [Roseivivax jejudonensis]SLN09984.1 periplasmic protein [Roseivivax jejudonensis]
MVPRHSFRGWGDQRPHPDVERGFHGRGDPRHEDPRDPYRTEPAGSDRESRLREAHRDPERDMEARRERERQHWLRYHTGPWLGPGMYPEVVAYPWAGTLAPRPGGRSDRPVWDRAADEVASWFGDEEAAGRRERDYSGVGPRNYRRSDARIEEDVNDGLTDDPALDATDIEVSVTDREVTLDGYVRSRHGKRRAEDCADAVLGVQHVQNNLRIRDSVSESEAFAPGSST